MRELKSLLMSLQKIGSRFSKDWMKATIYRNHGGHFQKFENDKTVSRLITILILIDGYKHF